VGRHGSGDAGVLYPDVGDGEGWVDHDFVPACWEGVRAVPGAGEAGRECRGSAALGPEVGAR